MPIMNMMRFHKSGSVLYTVIRSTKHGQFVLTGRFVFEDNFMFGGAVAKKR